MNQSSMTPEAFPHLDDEDRRLSVWRQNHGNFLAAFVACILVVGSGILACRQLQFHPPRFPDSRAFPDPVIENGSDDEASAPSGEVEEPGDGNPVDKDLRDVRGKTKPTGSERGSSRVAPAVNNQSTSKPASKDSQSPLRIIAAGASDNRGSMMFAIYGSKETFNQVERAIVREKRQIEKGKATWMVDRTKLPQRFAVAVYHDQNGDGKLDRNAFGIPTENYGYSNNARALMGPPKYEQAALDRPAPGQVMNIMIR